MHKQTNKPFIWPFFVRKVAKSPPKTETGAADVWVWMLDDKGRPTKKSVKTQGQTEFFKSLSTTGQQLITPWWLQQQIKQLCKEANYFWLVAIDQKNAKTCTKNSELQEVQYLR